MNKKSLIDGKYYVEKFVAEIQAEQQKQCITYDNRRKAESLKA